ncbi:E3 ubiquitin/ISG15 ligase TRIM25-like isoform X2 [Seriola lalandi dorsalis]|uniref:E3 ubiquitin/ISG15 ligase TRIM25-like isoform X2 n=1 Tax=Seriola lalandi dorsalis TaxID=1841481 RepID=UPI000C6F63F3|nr:E3 ubiquitin/ISG15 ligase TRIM25-like isoform X2 [Seriola lalandi dorsalis]
MADVAETTLSLMSLEDELTCSICLSTFDCPVTIPCGHNFCQDCLLATWEETQRCPQCRTHIPSKPELKKNTVLSAVVETFNLSSNKTEDSLIKEEKEAEEKEDVIRCDTCMEAEASQTCFTCMASFCEEHLRPHRENPKFAVHQLSDVVGDLSERICPEHNKLMELFCSQHDRPICSLCLQNVHKGCSFISPEEQRNLKESELRDKLSLLDGKIEKTDTVTFQMNDMRSKLTDGAAKRKAALAAAYQQMRDMLAQEERESQNEVDRELETGQAKLQDLMKKFTDNAVQMRKAREDINGLLSQSQTPSFLQASFDLPWVVKFEPYIPRISLDSKKVTATQAFAVALKEHLTETLKQPVEARLPIIKPELNSGIYASGEKPAPVSGPASYGRTGSQPEYEPSEPPEQRRPPRSHSPGCPPIQPYFQPVPVPMFNYMGSQPGWNQSQYSHGMAPNFNRAPPFKTGQKTHKKSDTSHQPPHGKKSDSSHQPAHKQDKKKPGTPGGNKPGATGPARKDNPKGHPPSQKPAGHHPRPKKN